MFLTNCSLSQLHTATQGEEYISPENWLQQKITQEEEKEKDLLDIPKRKDGSDYEIKDLYPDQKFVAYKVLVKLKEFMTCKDLSKFEPLRCTLVGRAGSGKTVLLQTIISVVRRMFHTNGVVKVGAPTGVSASMLVVKPCTA